MDTKVKGLVIKSKDYNEADRLLTILSAERGKIYVRSKGVKKQSSKLKGFCQNFCLADFELQEVKSGFILTGAKSIDFFFELSENYDKYTYACAILEILDKICRENIPYAHLLIDSLKSLRLLNYFDISPVLVLNKFILSLLRHEGIDFDTAICNNCKTPIMSEAYLDLTAGDILCPVCRGVNSIMVDRAVLSTIKILSSTSFDRLGTIKTAKNILLSTCMLLSTYLAEKYDISFNFIKLIS